MVVEDLAQVLGLARIGGDEADGEALAAPAVDVVDEPVELARVRIHGERLERDVGLPGGEDFQLDARTAGDDLDQRPAARRVFGGLVEQPRRVHDDGRAGGQILEEARGARVSRRTIIARSASASRWWPPFQSCGSRSGNSNAGAPKNLRSCAKRWASASDATTMTTGLGWACRSSATASARAAPASPATRRQTSPSANLFARSPNACQSLNISTAYGTTGRADVSPSAPPAPGRTTASPARSRGRRSSAAPRAAPSNAPARSSGSRGCRR